MGLIFGGVAVTFSLSWGLLGWVNIMALGERGHGIDKALVFSNFMFSIFHFLFSFSNKEGGYLCQFENSVTPHPSMVNDKG